MQLEEVEDAEDVIEGDQIQVLLIFEENALDLLKQLGIEFVQIVFLRKGHVIAKQGKGRTG